MRHAAHSMRAAVLATALLALALAAPPLEATSNNDAVADAVTRLLDYARSRQQSDGSFRAEQQNPTDVPDLGIALTPLAIQALSAAGLDPREVRTAPGNPSAPEWLRDHLYLYDATKASDWEKQILAIAAGYSDPTDFGGLDYLAQLRLLYLGGQMGDPGYLNDDAFGIFAYRAANVGLNDEQLQGMRAYLANNQNGDGSWGAGPGYPGDVDMTASVATALVAAAVAPQEPILRAAVVWLRNHQVAAGGFTTQGNAPNLQSTAWAVWALKSLHENPRGLAWTTSEGHDPVEWLVDHVRADGRVTDASGATRNLWEALDVLVALSAERYPVAAYLPVAPALTTSEPQAGWPVSFRNDEPADRYQWEFSDGAESREATPTHIFAHAGTSTVDLTAWRGDYGKGRAALAVTIDPSPPVAVLRVLAPRDGSGGPVAFSAQDSYDPDGRIVAFAWDLGDGTTRPWSEAARLEHAYAEPGTYRVRLEVRDDEGRQAASEADARVDQAAPWSVTFTVTPPQPHAGERVRLRADVTSRDETVPSVQWTLPQGQLREGTEVVVVFDRAGVHEVRYVLEDALGRRVEGTLSISVSEKPATAAGGGLANLPAPSPLAALAALLGLVCVVLRNRRRSVW